MVHPSYGPKPAPDLPDCLKPLVQSLEREHARLSTLRLEALPPPPALTPSPAAPPPRAAPRSPRHYPIANGRFITGNAPARPRRRRARPLPGSSFLALPCELHLLIMSYVMTFPSPRALQCLLLASPQHFRLFQQHGCHLLQMVYWSQMAEVNELWDFWQQQRWVMEGLLEVKRWLLWETGWRWAGADEEAWALRDELKREWVRLTAVYHHGHTGQSWRLWRLSMHKKMVYNREWILRERVLAWIRARWELETSLENIEAVLELVELAETEGVRIGWETVLEEEGVFQPVLQMRPVGDAMDGWPQGPWDGWVEPGAPYYNFDTDKKMLAQLEEMYAKVIAVEM